MKFVYVFIPIMLQKPSPKSKAATNAKYLKDGLEMWGKREMDKLMSQRNSKPHQEVQDSDSRSTSQGLMSIDV